MKNVFLWQINKRSCVFLSCCQTCLYKMEELYKNFGAINTNTEKKIIDEYSKGTSSLPISCAKEFGVWGIWLYIDNEILLVNPIELVNSLYLNESYYYLLSIYKEKAGIIVDVRIEHYYISWEFGQSISNLSGRYTFTFNEYVNKTQTAILALYDIYKKKDEVAYDLEGVDAVSVDAVRVCAEQVGIKATLPSYFALTTESVKVEDFVFMPLQDKWIEQYQIGIGNRKYDTWLTHWDSNMEAIRHELECFVYEGEATIRLPFDCSDTTIKICRKSALDTVTKSNSGTAYSYKSFVLVEIQPNGFVNMPIVKGFCEEKTMIRTLYEGLLNMARSHPVESKDESHDIPPSCIVAYNRYKSPVIEALLMDEKKAPNTYTTRQVHVRKIIKIDADYDTFLWDEESVALDLSDLYDKEGKPIQMEAFEKWHNEISPIIVDAAVGKSYEKDWDDYNKRGIELARKLRKQLSPDFDLWYEPPFEDDSENKRATLIL